MDLPEKAAELLLSSTPEDSDRNGLQETPRRFREAWATLTSGYSESVDVTTFEPSGEGMVIRRDITVYSLCEHHLLPFFGRVHIAYFPNPAVGIVGLSKLDRIVKMYSQRLQVQERLTQNILDFLQKVLQPKGIVVVLECRHLCMEMRGVRQASSWTTTHSASGCFKDDPGLMTQFLCLIGGISHSPPPICCPVETKEAIARDLGVRKVISEAQLYKIYKSFALSESREIALLIQECIRGPFSPESLRLMDVGAGNGDFTFALCEIFDNISRYAAFETNTDLRTTLRQSCASCLLEDSFSIDGTFPLDHTEEHLEKFDVVLLSHCLYGMDSHEQLALVDRALTHVDKHGVLLVVHRWTPEGALDKVSKYLDSHSILYRSGVWDTRLDLTKQTTLEVEVLSEYTKIPTDKLNGEFALHTIGFIAVERYSGYPRTKEERVIEVDVAKKRVSFLARSKLPAFVAQPATVTGVGAIVQTAVRNSHSLSCIGGGHSEYCIAEGAIAIDLSLWQNVRVDVETQLVFAGGGASVGKITHSCEQAGFLVPLGDRPGVGAGLVLQGGLNHFMRLYGLATDGIVEVTYLDVMGKFQRAQTDEDLFKFRGAGNQFGVVLEVVLKCHKIVEVWAQDHMWQCPIESDGNILTSYSNLCATLPITDSLDGFLFWSDPTAVSFASSHFHLGESPSPLDDSTSFNNHLHPIGSSGRYIPSELFDRELYMTDLFHSTAAVPPTQEMATVKLRSKKRCIFLGTFGPELTKTLYIVVRGAPTKWCYIHFLHGGGKVADVNPSHAAFGNRDWTFAAVVTGRWAEEPSSPDRGSVEEWLSKTMSLLQPYCQGIYSADLGSDDHVLSPWAYGPNHDKLWFQKVRLDPLNIFRHACPFKLQGDEKLRGIVVMICGRRCSGKDWLTNAVLKLLRNDISSVEKSSISDKLKQEYAKLNPGTDLLRLEHDRKYKENHREGLLKLYARRKAEFLTYDASCLVELLCNNTAKICIVAGVRNGLADARAICPQPLLMIKVEASNEAKTARGWEFNPEVDQSESEGAVDVHDDWDLKFQNELGKTEADAEVWVRTQLAPAVLKRCIRKLPNTPKPGTDFRDLSGILLQPFGLKLWTLVALDFLAKSAPFDVIIVPEATGFLFASPLASALEKPLVIVRKPNKLCGPVDRVSYRGSNIATRMDQSDSDCTTELQVASGVIQPGQSVLIIDDCLATGATCEAILQLLMLSGASVVGAAFVMEFPELRARDIFGESAAATNIFSACQFRGD